MAHGPLFTPFAPEKPTALVPGILGGANWGGAAFDPETSTLYVPSRLAPHVVTLLPIDPKQGNMRYQRADFSVNAGMDAIDGLLIYKPPYSRVTAIDLNRGEHRWMSAVGDGPRDHPLLKGLNVPPLGERLQNIGIMVTRTLVFVSTIPFASPSAEAEKRKLIYVFDKATGAPVTAIELDQFSAASPMTYLHQGRQYIVVATGSGPGSELIALSLPAAAAD
jgi:quinoprotein glucose dehydrogenase